MNAMSAPTRSKTLLESIADCNQQLDRSLRRQFGVTIKLYKVIKALTQLAGVVAVTLAMQQGMDPGQAGVIIGAIILGPEALETILLDVERDAGGDP